MSRELRELSRALLCAAIFAVFGLVLGPAVGSLIAVVLYAVSFLFNRGGDEGPHFSPVLLPDTADTRRTRALVIDLRSHATDLEKFRERMIGFLDRSKSQAKQSSLRAGFQSQAEHMGLTQRSQELYEEGRRWGFLQPTSDEGLFTLNDANYASTGTYRWQAERLREFADYIEQDQQDNAISKLAS